MTQEAVQMIAMTINTLNAIHVSGENNMALMMECIKVLKKLIIPQEEVPRNEC